MPVEESIRGKSQGCGAKIINLLILTQIAPKESSQKILKNRATEALEMRKLSERKSVFPAFIDGALKILQ